MGALGDCGLRRPRPQHGGAACDGTGTNQTKTSRCKAGEARSVLADGEAARYSAARDSIGQRVVQRQARLQTARPSSDGGTHSGHRSRRSVATSLGECCTTSLPPSAPSQHPSSLDETTTLGADSVTTLERPVATSLGDCCTTSLPPAAPSQHSSSLDETTALGARSATTLERPATKALPFRSESGKRGAGRGLG